MHPILFNVGPITVFSYGTMFALGFAVSFFLIYRQAVRNNIDKDAITNLAFIALVAGIIGGRSLYVAVNFGYYLRHPLETLNFSKGGLVYYGGFIAGAAAFAYYSTKKGVGFWNASDIFAPYLALTQSFGRIGCFLNGCCYGKAVGWDFPFGAVVSRSGELAYPTQVYSSLLLLLTYLVLRYCQGRRRFAGEIFIAYCMLYSLQRFFIEFLRGDNEPALSALTMSQVVSVFVFAAASALFIIKGLKWQKTKVRSALK